MIPALPFPSVEVEWKPAYRITPTRFPTIYLFDRVASPSDFEALYALEAMTNPRLREETGDLSMVAPEERRYGPGSGPIMAAFTHLNPMGSRFSNGEYGVFYAGKERETVIAETRFHSEIFLQATNEAPTRLQMRLYFVTIKGEVIDLRNADRDYPDLLNPGSYTASRQIGQAIRQAGANGLVYHSVRKQSGECVAAFRPRILSDCIHAAHFEYHWNGKEIDYITQQIVA